MPISLTILIIIVTIIASYYAWKNPAVQYKWMMNPYSISRNGSYFRFITSGFIHADGWHLFFNMLSLYFFGEVVESAFSQIYGQVFGALLFIGFYILGIIVSDIPTYLKYRNIPSYNALGASGGVSAIVFSSILFHPTAELCLYGFLCLPGFIWAIIYLIYSYYSGKKGADNINHDAHLYGAVFGIIFTVLVYFPVLESFISQVLEYRPDFF